MRRFCWVLVIPMIAVLVWLRPYLVGFYHVERGGRQLEAALQPVFDDRRAPEQILDGPALERAEHHYVEALRVDQDAVYARRQLVRIYLSQGKPEMALEVLLPISEAHQRNPLLSLELGDVYDALGRAERAVEFYEQGNVGSRQAPLVANLLKLSDVYVERGSADVAVGLWHRVLEIDPQNLYAFIRLIEIHRALGDLETSATLEAEIRTVRPRRIGIPQDFRLADYQAEAMIWMVDEGQWEHRTLVGVVSRWMEEGPEGVEALMLERILERLRAWMPAEAAFQSAGE